VSAIGNEWSRRYFDGPFYLHDAPAGRPAISLVFVQSKDGNTVAENPADLGGGPTDLHLIYEGLSRVAADAVLAGASSVGPNTLFTIHHPALVLLRYELGLPPHPTQIVLSKSARLDRSARIFNTPDVPSMVIDGSEPLPEALARLRRDHGIRRISCVGGRTTATSLVNAGLVQDIYLTTTAIEAGEPHTPWYAGGRPPRLETIVRKREVTNHLPLVFEHLAIAGAPFAR